MSLHLRAEGHCVFATIFSFSRGELPIMFCLLPICWHSHTDYSAPANTRASCFFFNFLLVQSGFQVHSSSRWQTHLFFSSEQAQLTTSLKALTSCLPLPPLSPTAVCSSSQGYVIRQRVAAVPLNASLHQPQRLPKSKNAIKSWKQPSGCIKSLRKGF